MHIVFTMCQMFTVSSEFESTSIQSMTEEEKRHFVIAGADPSLTTQEKAIRDHHIMDNAQKVLVSKWSCLEPINDYYYTSADGSYTFIVKTVVTAQYTLQYKYFERKNANVITLD